MLKCYDFLSSSPTEFLSELDDLLTQWSPTLCVDLVRRSSACTVLVHVQFNTKTAIAN